MAMEIRLGSLDHPEGNHLLREHLLSLARFSPTESRHALDPGSLRLPQITFWSAWKDAQLMGYGAI